MSERSQYAFAAVAVTAIIALASISYVAVVRVVPVQSTISLTGTGSMLVVPDQLVVSFATDTQASSASAALQANGQLMNGVIEALKNTGLSGSELSTSSPQVQPVYNSTKAASTLIGYMASNAVTITTNKTGETGQYIDAAVSAGANRVNFAYFTVSDGMQGRVKDALISMAVGNAGAEAKSALSPLGLRTIGVQSMSIIGGSVPLVGRTDQTSAPTPMLPGQQQVSAAVQVTFLIGP